MGFNCCQFPRKILKLFWPWEFPLILVLGTSNCTPPRPYPTYWLCIIVGISSSGIELRGILSLIFAYKLLTEFTWRFCLILFWEFQTAPSRILAMICSKIAKCSRWLLITWNWLWIEEQGYRLSKWVRKHKLGHSKSL